MGLEPAWGWSQRSRQRIPGAPAPRLAQPGRAATGPAPAASTAPGSAQPLGPLPTAPCPRGTHGALTRDGGCGRCCQGAPGGIPSLAPVNIPAHVGPGNSPGHASPRGPPAAVTLPRRPARGLLAGRRAARERAAVARRSPTQRLAPTQCQHRRRPARPRRWCQDTARPLRGVRGTQRLAHITPCPAHGTPQAVPTGTDPTGTAPAEAGGGLRLWLPAAGKEPPRSPLPAPAALPAQHRLLGWGQGQALRNAGGSRLQRHRFSTNNTSGAASYSCGSAADANARQRAGTYLSHNSSARGLSLIHI